MLQSVYLTFHIFTVQASSKMLFVFSFQPKSTEFILLVASERSYDDTNGKFLKQNVKGKVGKSVSTTVYGYNRLRAYYFAGLVNIKAHREHPH